MKSIKILLIIVSIFILILIGILIYFNVVNKNETNQNDGDVEYVDENEEELDEDELNEDDDESEELETEDIVITDKVYPSKIERVKDRNAFYTVEKCIEEYLKYNVEQDYETLYLVMLNGNFVNQYGVTIDNVSSKIDTFYEEQTITIMDMYQREVKKDYTEYYVHTKIRDTISKSENEENPESDYYITVVLDTNSKYYTINPSQDYCRQQISEYSE